MLKNTAEMKVKVVLVLIGMSISIMSPLSINISHSGNGTFFFTLDVCNAAGSARSVTSDMPVLHECPCKVLPAGFIGFCEVSNPMFNLSLIPFQKERPPKF